MDKRQNIYEASAEQAKSFATGANLLRDQRQSIAIATLPASLVILPVGIGFFRFFIPIAQQLFMI